MRTYLRSFDLWEVVKTDAALEPLRGNPTLAQIKHHSEEKAKKHKALTCIQSAVTDVIFTRIMTCESAKEAWDKLKEEFYGSDKTRQMQVINLRREFEVLKMEEDETIRQYSDRLMKVVNQIRLLGEELTDSRIVEKVLVSVPERFEAKISSLEDSKDFSSMSLTELVNSLQASEQRRAIREKQSTEGALFARQNHKPGPSGFVKKQVNEKKDKEKKEFYNNKGGGRKGNYPPCPHCKKRNHTENFCWFRPGVQCRNCKQFGHIEKMCKNKGAAIETQQA